MLPCGARKTTNARKAEITIGIDWDRKGSGVKAPAQDRGASKVITIGRI
jgi:hypothetical protein